MRPIWTPLLLCCTVLACGGGGEAAPATTSVYKSQGSLQCTGGGATLAALQAQLTGAGLTVLSASCGLDGNAYPAVCGAGDGRIGIFALPTAQAATAATLGFAPLSGLPAALRTACP